MELKYSLQIIPIRETPVGLLQVSEHLLVSLLFLSRVLEYQGIQTPFLQAGGRMGAGSHGRAASQAHPGCCSGKEHQGFLAPLVPVSLLPSPLQNGSHHYGLGNILVSVRFLICLLFLCFETQQTQNLKQMHKMEFIFSTCSFPKAKLTLPGYFSWCGWLYLCWSSFLTC